MVKEINEKMEGFLKELGGLEYCKNILNRNLNSVDILVYVVYKYEMQVFDSEEEVKLYFIFRETC